MTYRLPQPSSQRTDAHRHRRLHSLSILLALVTASVAVAASGHAVPLAGPLGIVPAGLPRITLTDWHVLPQLLPGAAAVAVVALAQAADIPRTVSGQPTKCGSRGDGMRRACSAGQVVTISRLWTR